MAEVQHLGVIDRLSFTEFLQSFVPTISNENTFSLGKEAWRVKRSSTLTRESFFTCYCYVLGAHIETPRLLWCQVTCCQIPRVLGNCIFNKTLKGIFQSFDSVHGSFLIVRRSFPLLRVPFVSNSILRKGSCIFASQSMPRIHVAIKEDLCTIFGCKFVPTQPVINTTQLQATKIELPNHFRCNSLSQ